MIFLHIGRVTSFNQIRFSFSKLNNFEDLFLEALGFEAQKDSAVEMTKRVLIKPFKIKFEAQKSK
jgi:hypothetical protein